jgi:hypothetical protein
VTDLALTGTPGEVDNLEVVDAELDYEGIVYDLPEEDYHAHHALSSTQVKWILDSPARYRYNLDHPQPFKKAFDEGSAVHALVLGTGWEVVTIPADLLSGANKAIASAEAKAWVANARANNQIPLKAHEVAKVQAIAASVLADPDAAALLEGCRSEVSVFAHDGDTGVDMRCRFDALHPDLDYALDLKSMAGSATKAGFSKAVADFKYDVSHEHYLDTLELATGIRPPKFYIAVEKEPPYFTAVFRLSDDEIEMGRKEARAARRALAASRMTDYWPHRRTGIQTTEAPMRRIYDHIDRFKEIA